MNLIVTHAESKVLTVGDWVQFQDFCRFGKVDIPTGTIGHVVNVPHEDSEWLEIVLHHQPADLHASRTTLCLCVADFPSPAEFTQMVRAMIHVIPTEQDMLTSVDAETHLRKVRDLFNAALEQVATGGHHYGTVESVIKYLENNFDAVLPAKHTIELLNNYLVSRGV